MRKTFLLILLTALAVQAQAVRYGLKKQVQIDSVTVQPEYLAYSPANHRMYCGGTWSGRVYWFDCLTDEPQGQIPGAMSPAPMAYDSVNNRIYYKGGNEYFYAIDCASNTLDTSWGGYQGGTLAEYNATNNKIYLWDDFNDQTLIHSGANYSYLGLFSPWKGSMHHFGPTNRVYVPHAFMDSLGVFDGATNAQVGSVSLPGLSSNFNEKMASSPANGRLYLTLPNTDQLAVVNTASNSLVNVLAVGDNPVAMALCPLNNRMFIACNGASQHSLMFVNMADVLDSVAVGDSVSVVAYNPTDSLIYIGCQRTGQIKLVDPRLPTPLVVDSISVEPNLRYMDMKVDQDGDVYCVASNYSEMFVVGKIPQRIWQAVSSGYWNEYWTWDYSDDGGYSWTGNAMMYLPNAADSLIYIPAAHSVDVEFPVAVDQLVVAGGLNINSDFTILDGPGTDVQVDGFLQRQGGVFSVMPGATLAFGTGSQYNHQLDGDTIPAASWDSLSTVNITGVMSTTPAGLDQAFGNLSWDCFQQAGDHVLPGGPSFSVRNLIVSTTGPGSLILTSAAKPELTVENFTLYGANAVLGSGGNRKLRVTGDFTVYDPGWLYLTDSLNPGIDTLFLYGDYFHTLAGIAGGGPDSTAIVFCGTDTQSYVGAGEVLTGYIDFVVFPGSHLLIPEWEALGQGSLGNFKLMAGAGLSYSDMFGLYPTGWDEGVIRTQGVREYSQGANYRIYSWGTGPYHAGPGLPDTVNQLIIESYGDQVYLDKDLAVMDTLKLLANNLLVEGYRLSLFGPILKTSGDLVGDGACQLAVMGGDPAPLSLPGQFRDVGTLTINRPAVVTLSDTMLVHSRLELINGTLDNGGNKLTFQNTASIFRSGTSSLAGAGPVMFVNQVGLEYGAGTITAGPEMPASNMAIMYLAVKGSNDTLIVDRDTLNVWNNLSLSGGLRFNGKSFWSYGILDTTGPAGELTMTDSGQALFMGPVETAYLPAITGGSLSLDNSAGFVMRRDISCSGPLTLSSGSLSVGSSRLVLGDSLSLSGPLLTDSTSGLVFYGNPVGVALPSSVTNLGSLAWDRPAAMFITGPLIVNDSLKLGQGTVDNSANLTIRAGATIVRNSGQLVMPPMLEGGVDVIYGSHGGGTMYAGNELPSNLTDLNNLTLSIGMMSNDTIALSGQAQVNGRLSLEQGVLSVGANTLTLRDTIDIIMGQLEVDSMASNLWVLGCPYPFALPSNIKQIGGLYLESAAGMTIADTLVINNVYRQHQGHLLGGQLRYGPAGSLAYYTVGLDTTSDRELPPVGGPRDLMVNTGGSLYLHSSRLVSGDLTLSSPLITGANTVTIDSFGTVSGGSFVEGNLAKLVPVSGDTSITYQLGTAPGGPSPVEIRAFNNTVPAFITAGIKGAGHPLVNDSSSCLKKYWTFSGTGLGADACQITLNYLPGDFNAPGFEEDLHESTMVAGRYDPPYSAWQLPGIIARNAYGTNDGGSIVLAHSGNFNDSPEFTLGRDSLAIINQAGDLTPPYIVSTQPADGAVQASLTVPVRITFSEPIDPASFAYSFIPNPGGLSVAWSADSLEASIAHGEFLPDTLYLVEVTAAMDTAGNPLSEGPAVNPWSFRTASQPLVASTVWQGGAWRLFSAPVSPVDSSAVINLGDDLGAYGQNSWLMYGYQPASDSFIARPGIQNGQAYWLASVNSAGLDVYGYKTETHRTVALQAGWNLVGCPFQEPVALPMVEVIDSSGAVWAYNDTSNSFFVNDSLVRQRMWTYGDQTFDLVNNGGWDSLSAFDTSSHLMPWQGYAVYAVRPCSLFMMPAFKSSGKFPVSMPQPEVLWQVEFTAISGGAADRGLRIGLSPQAKAGYDRLDAEKPPLVGNQVAAVIPHPEWGGPCRSYHYDFRPPADHIEWPLSVRVSGTEEPAQLSYRLSAPLPEGYDLYLADRQSGKVSRLEGSGQVGFSGSREFSVVYTNRGLEGLSLKPLRFDLNRAYPNPFSGSITVNYQLAQAGRASLKVYNVAGQLVKTLAEGQSLPGYYSRTWDGRDNAGRRISSGVYIVRLESAEGLATRKLVKIK